MPVYTFVDLSAKKLISNLEQIHIKLSEENLKNPNPEVVKVCMREMSK